MIYVCDHCHFLFSRTTEPDQCPDCGKYAIRRAAEAEEQEFKDRLSKKEPWGVMIGNAPDGKMS